MVDTQLAHHWFIHTPHSAIGIGAMAKAGSRLPTSPAVPCEPPPPLPEVRRLRVGLVAGSEESWRPAVERLAEHFFRDEGLEIGDAWDCADLGIEDSTDYDCLVLLGWPAASRRELLKRIGLYCRGGGSLVALRAMHAALPDWPSFAEEVLGGRQLPGKNCRLLEVNRAECAWHHPVVQGLGTLIAEGEGYSGPRFSPDTTVLLKTVGSSQSGHGDLPVAWVRRHEGGRVFCSTLGVDDDFGEPSFLGLISRAVHWVGMVHG
jgi:hypothetical protein